MDRVVMRSRMCKSLFAAIFLLLCSLLMAQQGLNNDAIIRMVNAGLSDDVIITTINASSGSYDTSANGLITLKQAGASDKIIAAIIVKASGTAKSSAAPQVQATPNSEEMPISPPESTSLKAGEPTASGTVVASGLMPAGARVVIAPMGGFETYFAAAIREKKVPITLTLDKNSAQYFVVSTETEWQGFVFGSGGSANWNRLGGSAAYGSSGSSTRGLEASIMLIDAKSKDVVWAYEVHKNSHGALLFGTLGVRGQQSLAEACAKHLRDFIKSESNGLAPSPQMINKGSNQSDSHSEPSVTGGKVHLNAASAPISDAPVPPAQSVVTGDSVLPVQGIITPTEKGASDDPETQFQHGEMYQTGRGVPRDYALAALWFRKAAEQNFAPAQYRLGILYAAGVGVPIDKAQAANWFQKAAIQGYADAQEVVGLDYLTGDGVPRDYGEAFFWLAIAASSNTAESVARQRASERDQAAIHLKPADLSRKEEQVQKWIQNHSAKP